MIVVCPKCSSQIQVSGPDSERPSSIRCPNCNVNLKAPGTTASIPRTELATVSPASEKSALTVGQSPSTDHQRFKARVPAPLFEMEKKGRSEPTSSLVPMEDMGQLLANILRQQSNNSAVSQTTRPAWNPRKALVCTAEIHREAIARHLSKNGYQVFVAQDTGQAVDRMRENQLEVVLLDPEFDSTEQGAAFVIREVNVLRPAQRRRLFFVLLSPLQRTMDAHAAFLHNVNAIVNFKELDDLFGILEHALREYNELYKEFNLALNVAAL
jgi:CheY-like chemotaxis protein